MLQVFIRSEDGALREGAVPIEGNDTGEWFVASILMSLVLESSIENVDTVTLTLTGLEEGRDELARVLRELPCFAKLN
jgi:hypothetical protein